MRVVAQPEPAQAEDAAPPPAVEEPADVVSSMTDAVGDSQMETVEPPQDTVVAPLEKEPEVVAEETVVVLEEAIPLNVDAESFQAVPVMPAPDAVGTSENEQGEFVSTIETVIVVEDAAPTAVDTSEGSNESSVGSAFSAEETTATEDGKPVAEDHQESPQEA
jgi:hypothetical protein